MGLDLPLDALAIPFFEVTLLLSRWAAIWYFAIKFVHSACYIPNSAARSTCSTTQGAAVEAERVQLVSDLPRHSPSYPNLTLRQTQGLNHRCYSSCTYLQHVTNFILFWRGDSQLYVVIHLFAVLHVIFCCIIAEVCRL